MKMLVATSNGQGGRANDFCFTVEHELVHRPFECGGVTAYTEEIIDDHCGCHRAWGGLASSKATTTCEVADLPLGREDLIAALHDYYERGWNLTMSAAELGDEADTLLEIADTFDVGTVIERRGDRLVAR
ncbi:MAG TPA: hypothetical protein VHD87_15630 [Acidimicrobiales bacterium]|nr:hypothetical protein [Acidimicrobiales bacterium]